MKIELILFSWGPISLTKMPDVKAFGPGFYVAYVGKMLSSALTRFLDGGHLTRDVLFGKSELNHAPSDHGGCRRPQRRGSL